MAIKKHEQIFCGQLQKWCKYNMKYTFCWEAKICTTKSLNYKAHIPDHQRNSLLMCGSHFVYKISDMDRMQKPMDGISIAEAPGYFFIKFINEKIRSNKTFYIIEVSRIEKEIEGGSKSLTEKRASEIADIIGQLK